VDAVGAAGFNEIRAVVEDEERAVVLARSPERLRRHDEVFVDQRLVAQLDDVDATAQRSVEQRARIVAARQCLEHEVEAGARQALMAVRRGATHQTLRLKRKAWEKNLRASLSSLPVRGRVDVGRRLRRRR
jgi:hypothetical protein